MAERIAQAQTLIFMAMVGIALITFIPEKKNGKWPWDQR